MAMNPRLLRPLATSRWTPVQLPNLQLWLDAADASTITLNGSSVSQWDDKSGNGRHFSQTADATHQPAYVTSGINGRGSIGFDGINDRLGRDNEAWAYNFPVAVFAVFRATAFTNAYNGLFGFYGNSTGSARSYGVLVKSNGKSAIYGATTAGGTTAVSYDGTGSVTYSTATTHVFSATLANNLIQSFGDGSSDGTISTSFTLKTNAPDPILRVNIGTDALFSRFTDWQIGEAIMISGAAITQQNRQRTEGYLAHKWGSAGQLPADHPYKAARP
jgi:hypothetical protein